jgi:hypothetical protein
MIQKLQKILLLILLIAFSNAVKAQSEEDTIYAGVIKNRYVQSGIGPILAYRGFNNHFLEVGITRAWASHGIGGIELSFLSNLRGKDERLHGYSFSKYLGFAFFEVAATGTLYTNYQQAKLYITPSIGLGIGGIATVNYGYNFSLGDSWINDRISRHEIRIVLRYPFGIF